MNYNIGLTKTFVQTFYVRCYGKNPNNLWVHPIFLLMTFLKALNICFSSLDVCVCLCVCVCVCVERDEKFKSIHNTKANF